MNFIQNSTGKYDGFCIIKAVEKKMTSKGSPYLSLTLSDQSGDIDAKLWDYHEKPGVEFKVYDFIKVRGDYVPFNNDRQFRIDMMRHVREDDGVSVDDYVPSAVLPGEMMYDEVQKAVFDFKDEEIRMLVMAILDKYRERLIYWPAAKALHHAIRGGLLMHTLTMLRLANSVCDIYTYLNRDLLLAGVILHDITKIKEIDAASTGVPGEYTVPGNLIGHLVMGAIEIDETAKEKGVSPDTAMLLEHMLISHHGIPEYGAAKYPMTLEAEALSMIDDLDAKMYEFSSAIFRVEPGEFTDKQKMLDNRPLFNHGRSNDGDVNLI